MRRFLATLAAVAAFTAGLEPALGAAASHATVGAPPSRATAGANLGLGRVLARDIKQAGASSGAYVVDLDTGRALYSAAAGVSRLPASVEKVYTTSTALLRFGPQATLQTVVLGQGTITSRGAWHGTLYLRGGGDPTFASQSFDPDGATLQRLVADLVRSTGITSVQGRIVGDESYFDSLRGTPASGYRPSVDTEGLLSGLAYDRGFADQRATAFQRSPAPFAAGAFASALRSAGVRVPAGTPIRAGIAPTSAKLFAMVASPPIASLIQLTNTSSDNFLAEMLLKGVGARFGTGGSTAAGAAVVRAELAGRFGIHPRLQDGSGLSRADRTTPMQVVIALKAMARDRYFVSSLATAGKTGTLRYEAVGTAAQGRCRGKTGTLHDVASLAGYCQASDGHTLAFAFLMNSVDPSFGHSLEAQMAVALAKYDG
ncbi:MAG: D-alanyl-D-alanine carboxypeptidase/D-alanyl-D-alanine endopeptidase [Solirubrobacteraceae bacterium]